MRLETWFSGGGLADIGFKNAGLTPSRAVELKPKIAAIYSRNLGDHCIVADVRDYAKSLDGFVPDWFHVSPPCQNASVAKTDQGETELDRELANAIVLGLRRLPKYFSLENVWSYRDFDAFRVVLQELVELGYRFNYWLLNSADYGVPQSRKRLILIANRDDRVIPPMATHAETRGFFFEPWVGWGEVVGELEPEFKDASFAKWQEKVVASGHSTAKWKPSKPVDYLATTKYRNCNAKITYRLRHEPAPTVTASENDWRCVIGGRVSLFSPRAIARLQSLPDWYELPTTSSLANTVIGNGVPCLVTQRLAEAQLT